MIEPAPSPRIHERSRFAACLALACVLHAWFGLALALRGARRAQAPAAIVTEVELAAPEPRAPERMPVPAPKPAPTEAPRPKPERTTRPHEAARAPQPSAAAAKLLTADEHATTPADEEPVRFVTDPNGRGYGYGLVARGGVAAAAPRPAAVARSSSNADAVTPADQLARAPSLLAEGGCRGYFPGHASADRAEVALVAVVADTGAVARLEVERETPRDQGFAAAARACLREQRFAPALDKRGRTVRARTRITLHFMR